MDTLKGANAMYGGGRRITVALDAAENAYVQAGVHEMVHYVQNYDEGAYTLLEGVVSEYLTEAGMDIEEEIGKRIAEYSGRQELTREGALAEIVAEAAPTVFTDEDAVRELIGRDRNLVEKIRDFFIDFVKTLDEIAERYAGRMKRQEIAFLSSNTDALMKIADTLDMALVEAGKAEKGNGQEALSIKTTSDGGQYVSVDVDQERFDGLDRHDLVKEAQKVIREKFVGKIVGRDHKAFVGGRTANEYTHPAAKIKSDEMFTDKMRASTELDRLFEVSEYIGHNDDDGRHPDATGGWDHYRTVFEVGGRFYEGDISVMIRDNGRLLYDVTKLRETKKKHQGPSGQSGSTPPARSRTDVSDSSIPDSAENVNAKYSLNNQSGENADMVGEVREEERGEMQNAAGRLARSTVKEYRSTMRASGAAAQIDEMIGAYQAHDEARAQEIADRLAQEIVMNSRETDVSHREGYEEIRRRLRTEGFSLTDAQRQEVANRYGSYSNWRRSVMGSVRAKGDAASLDSVWEQMSGMHPEYFPADAKETEMPGYVEAFVRAMRPQYSNPYGFDTAGAAADLSMRLRADVMDMMGSRERAQQLREDSDSLRQRTSDEQAKRTESRQARRQAEFSRIANEMRTAKDQGDAAAMKKLLDDYRRLKGGRSTAADAVEAGMVAREYMTEARRVERIISELGDQIADADTDAERAKLVRERERYEEMRDEMRRIAARLHRQQVIDRLGMDAESEAEQWDEEVLEEMQREMDEDMCDMIGMYVEDVRGRVQRMHERGNETHGGSFSVTSAITQRELEGLFADVEGEIIQHSELRRTWARRQETAREQAVSEQDHAASLRMQLNEARSRGDVHRERSIQIELQESQDRLDVLNSQVRQAERQTAYHARMGAESLSQALNEGRLPQPIMERVIALCRDAGRRGTVNELLKPMEAQRESWTFPIRVWDDLFGNAAPMMRAIYYDKVMDNETRRQKWIADWRERIKALRLTAEESALVQEIGEGRLNPQDARYQAAGQKVYDAVQVFRAFYDEAHAMTRRALERNGYEAPGFIGNYFPHIEKAKSFFDKLGVAMDGGVLPTSINGLTETFSPGKQYSGHLEHRTGEKTDYDALYGFEQYIGSISSIIYHTDDIRRHRQLESEIRAAAKRGVFDGGSSTSHMSEFAAWLHEYANQLAGKKSVSDRDNERIAGRPYYRGMDILKKIHGANTMALNLGSALTNLVPIEYVLGHPQESFRAILQTLAEMKTGRADGRPESQFMIRRFGSDSLVKTAYARATDWMYAPMGKIDEVTTRFVVNMLYQANIQRGMDSETAMRSADVKAARLMADRSKGALPTAYGNKLVSMFTQYQTEVANQSQYFRKDVARTYGKQGTFAVLMGTAALGWLWNELFERLTGRRPALDPIETAKELMQGVMNGDGAFQVVQGLYGNISDMFPYSSGEIPALSLISGNAEGGTEGNWSDVAYVGKELAWKLLPGFGQVKKSVRGGLAAARGGYYNGDMTKLKFPVEGFAESAKAVLFGVSGTQAGIDYYAGDAPGLTESQTENYEQARERGYTSNEAYRNEVDKAAAEKLMTGAKASENEDAENKMLAEIGEAHGSADLTETENMRREAASLRSEAMPGEELTDFWWEKKDEPGVQAAIEHWRATGETWALPKGYGKLTEYTIGGSGRYLGAELAEEADRMYAEGYAEIMDGADLSRMDEEERKEIENALEKLKREVDSHNKERIIEERGEEVDW